MERNHRIYAKFIVTDTEYKLIMDAIKDSGELDDDVWVKRAIINTAKNVAKNKTIGKEARKYKKELEKLSQSCFIFLRKLDEVMKLPESASRGRMIARLSNELEYANDKVRYHSLGVDYRKDNKDKLWERMKKKGEKTSTRNIPGIS